MKKGVSKKIRDSARDEDCLLMSGVCNFNPETTSYIHVSLGFNSGVATKPHDLHGIYGCSSCHDVLDGRCKQPDDFSSDDVLRALVQTQLKLIDKGLVKIYQ